MLQITILNYLTNNVLYTNKHRILFVIIKNVKIINFFAAYVSLNINNIFQIYFKYNKSNNVFFINKIKIIFAFFKNVTKINYFVQNVFMNSIKII
jgi:hypothetical protein